MVERGEVERRQACPSCGPVRRRPRCRRPGSRRWAGSGCRAARPGARRPAACLGLGVRDDCLERPRQLDERRSVVRRRRSHCRGCPLRLRPRLVGAVDRGVACGQELLERLDVQDVATPGEPTDGVGGRIEEDAGVVHPFRLSPLTSRFRRPRRSSRDSRTAGGSCMCRDDGARVVGRVPVTHVGARSSSGRRPRPQA